MSYKLIEDRLSFVLNKCSALCYLLLIACLLINTNAEAEELYMRPLLSVKTLYDDNIRLRPDAKGIDTSAYGVITTGTVDLGVTSEIYSIGLKNQFIINRYDSDFDLDSDDFNIDLTSNYNLSQKSQIGLTGNFTQDTTLTSELGDDGGTGLVQDNLTRQQWAISPNYSYSITPTQLLQASYSHSEVDYEESDVGSFVDYKIDFASLSYQNQWTEIFSNSLSITAMFFDIPDIKSGNVKSSRETAEYSVHFGVNYQFFPTWSTSFSVGQRFTNTKSKQFIDTPFEQSISDDVNGLIFSFGFDKQLETGDVGLNYSRSTSAQGNGLLQVQDRVTVNYKQELSQRISIGLIADYTLETTSGSGDDGNDRVFYKFRPSIKWLFNRQASVTANYQYRRQDRERNDTEAESNSVSLNFNYQWDKIATQR